MSNVNYYEVLGVERNASQSQLKQAFRKLAMQWHPDRHTKDKSIAEQKIKAINEAYEVLSDPAKRAQYDQFGSTRDRQQAGAYGAGSHGFNQGFDGFNINDIFSGFSDMFRDAGEQRTKEHQPGADLKYRLSITLIEAFYGKEETIQFSAQSACEDCHSTGSSDGAKHTCNKCNGSGRVRVQQGFFIMEQKCQTCDGFGTTIKNICKTCKGNGRLMKQRSISVTIPAGTENNMSLRVNGKGESGYRGGKSGDLYVQINITEHELFKRSNSDLTISLPISFATLALGGDIIVPLIDGKTEKIKVPQGTQSEHKLTISGKGMPLINRQQRGNMYVILKVEVPKKMTKDQKEAIMKMDKIINPDKKNDNFFEKVGKIF